MQQQYVIDGERFETLEGFYDEVTRVLLSDAVWGRNLDAFNDALRGGFGTPHGGFVLRWVNSAISCGNLSFAETVKHLELKLARCHPDSRDQVRHAIELAKQQQGATLFDWLVGIIRDHGPGGDQAESGIVLVLE